MKSFLRRWLKALAPIALTSIAACGGPELVEDDGAQEMSIASQGGAATAFNPLSQLKAAVKLANQKTDYAAPFHLSGTLVNGVYAWTWTLGGDDGTMVEVAVDVSGAKVTAVHKNTVRPLGIAIISADKITVDPAALVQTCKGHRHTSLPKAIQLSQALTVDMHAHWFADYAQNDVVVDAVTGAVLQ